MSKIIKITPENTTWEELLNNWEKCNNDRIKEQKEKIIFQNNFNFWRNRAEELERILETYKKENNILKNKTTNYG